MEEFLSRTISLIGESAVKKLQNSTVMVFGAGGVGGYTIEGLARAGVGKIIVVDGDVIAPSNLNRQIIATINTINMPKVEAGRERILSINPNCKVETYNLFVTKDNINQINFNGCDFVVDAIDTITTKIEIIKKAQSLNIPLISSMGTGNKLNAEAFMFADINNTKVCPLCKVMRKLCKENGISNVKVLYSQETPIKPAGLVSAENSSKTPPASISFVPAVAGLLIAGEVIKTITNCWGEGVDNS